MRRFSVSFSAVAVTAQVDFFEVVAGTNNPIEITGLSLGQSTDAGDSEAEQAYIELVRGYTTSGAGGASATPVALDSGAASNATAETNNTTLASTGTPVTPFTTGFNLQAGLDWNPTPEQYVRVAGGERLVVRLGGAPADSVSFSGTLFYIEH